MAQTITSRSPELAERLRIARGVLDSLDGTPAPAVRALARALMTTQMAAVGSA